MDPALRELLSAVVEHDDEGVEAIIRLDDPSVAVPGVRLVARFGSIATCRLAASAVRDVREDDNVLSLKASRPLGPEKPPEWMPPIEPPTADARRRPDTDLTGAG